MGLVLLLASAAVPGVIGVGLFAYGRNDLKGLARALALTVGASLMVAAVAWLLLLLYFLLFTHIY